MALPPIRGCNLQPVYFHSARAGLAVVALFAQSFTYIASRKSSGQKKRQ
jgi:hypothetical protein